MWSNDPEGHAKVAVLLTEPRTPDISKAMTQQEDSPRPSSQSRRMKRAGHVARMGRGKVYEGL